MTDKIKEIGQMIEELYPKYKDRVDEVIQAFEKVYGKRKGQEELHSFLHFAKEVVDGVKKCEIFRVVLPALIMEQINRETMTALEERKREEVSEVNPTLYVFLNGVKRKVIEVSQKEGVKCRCERVS